METHNIEKLTGAQKSAILIMTMGKERSAKVLKSMREAEVTEIMAEVARMANVDDRVVEQVLGEFAVTASARRHVAIGGVDVARELLEATVGERRADEIFEQLNMSMMSAPFEFLRKADPRLVLGFIRDEHPQTIALVLAYMTADSASMVLSGLPEELQREVAVRVATMDRTTPDIVATVESALERRLSSVIQQGDLSSVGGVQTLVDLLNRSDRATERLIFEGLENHDEVLADEVRSMMFVFEDILTLDDRSVQQVLRQVDSKDLALALKGVREEVKRKILDNISSRAAENLQEEIDMLGAVRLTAVEEAQGAVVRVIRALEEAGQIVLTRSGDEYVE
ncbi:flagellar motor switch protein FliG [Actinomarinicola tropica]|uniref:Flagellar motor switch protein FliG n=1 Tax=Actinomarinicola tropica TaxID=2789776 RepID=A0A5Q2RR95_9ACTN|nr:flagellar motor switch protein FliG [Actinomarinicola tropica]QGG96986.1 flagellar motor switch protein FliG [Actinomarinicola tropica]